MQKGNQKIENALRKSELLTDLSPTQMDKLIDVYINSNTVFKMFSPNFINKYKKICKYQLIKYNNLKTNEKYKKLCKFWKTWDNFALSILYLKFLKYMCGEKYLKNKFIIYFSQLLLTNINPNPEKRLTLEETLKKFNAILYDNDIDNVIVFNDLVEQFIKNKNNLKRQISIDIKNNNYLTKKISK